MGTFMVTKWEGFTWVLTRGHWNGEVVGALTIRRTSYGISYSAYSLSLIGPKFKMETKIWEVVLAILG